MHPDAVALSGDNSRHVVAKSSPPLKRVAELSATQGVATPIGQCSTDVLRACAVGIGHQPNRTDLS